jgi:uncharacterized membrane protein SpoIIM required for sporulation
VNAALYPAWIIVRREVRDQFRDWRIIFPIVGLTLVFPFIMNWTAKQMLDFVSDYGATVIADRMVPFLLMVVGFFPISVSLVIALESFVGEKERSSIEPLLNTPMKDWQLYLGKLVSSTVPPLASSYTGMLVYLVGLWLNHVKMPGANILIQVIMLTTVQAIMMVAGAVVVSTQTTSVRAANLLSSFIVIPSAFLIQWESLVMFWGNESTLWWVVVAILLITGLLVRVGVAHFQREELLGKDIDVLKVRWMWGVFARAFKGETHSLGEWYRRSLTATLRRLGLPVLAVILLVVFGIGIGIMMVNRYPFLLPVSQTENLDANLANLLAVNTSFRIELVPLIFWQNLRVLLLALIVGIFSFGVVGVFPLMATMAVGGYLVTLLASNGIPLLNVLFLLLPHTIIELPAAVLATAAVLRMGAVLATPTPGKTFSEVWLAAMADWAKVMAGLVVPMLVVASFIEVLVTPRIALMLFR